MYKLVASVLSMLLCVLPCLAQEPQSSSNRKLLIPAGTSITAVLVHPIASNLAHIGGEAHLQIVSPVVIGTQVAIPAGTYLQGRLSTIAQHDNQVQLGLESASLAFGNGYVAPLSAPVTLQSQQGWLRPAPSNGKSAAFLPLIFLPAAGMGIGAAEGQAKGAGIGMATGLGILAVAAIAYHARHNGPNFYLNAGAPMDTVLVSAVSLDSALVAQAISQGPTQPVQPIVARPQPVPPTESTSTGTCFAPDTPGTPDRVIPGTPATADTPGTPDIVIPGTPSVPGGIIPCG